MKRLLLVVMLLAGISGTLAAGENVILPFETSAAPAPANVVDDCVLAALREKGIEPASHCSDEVFLRRVYLDVIGALPSPMAVQEFLKDQRPDKRAAVIDSLLTRGEFADYWAMKWCDVLRVKAEYPINLWPNAVQAYHRWVRDAIRDNMPYDEFARELLTASGSNFRVPQANFYRAVQGREPSNLADAVALTFMGTRLDKWPKEKRADMAAFFSRVRYKPTAEWKEEIVYLDPERTEAMECLLPDGSRAAIAADEDPRRAFASWLTSKDNPWFARCAVNRVWAWLMGRGIISEVDDIRPDNPPSNPALLACLEKELAAADYDLKHVYRLILNSRTYQQSCIPRSDSPDAEALFAYYPVRRLDAEVLIDALCAITGMRESYSSLIPEPFTYIPEEQPAVALADGSITSDFLEMFGRPPRDTGLASERSNDPTDAQRLHLLNSTHIRRKIEQSGFLETVAFVSGGDRREVIRTLYLNILSRFPMQSEIDIADRYFTNGTVNPAQAAGDLAWALINSKEFLYRH